MGRTRAASDDGRTPVPRPVRAPFVTVVAAILPACLALNGGSSSTAAAPPDAAPTVVDTGPPVGPVDWFSDWQTCIWGIGVPSVVAARSPTVARTEIRRLTVPWRLENRLRTQALSAYGARVVAACESFVAR